MLPSGGQERSVMLRSVDDRFFRNASMRLPTKVADGAARNGPSARWRCTSSFMFSCTSSQNFDTEGQFLCMRNFLGPVYPISTPYWIPTSRLLKSFCLGENANLKPKPVGLAVT